ncbi:hypothetical protein CQA66_01865 [Helicobacter aurati]|uniref:Phosphatidylserine decarboxylase n=1 Tax=Helicobacter aurati TaxID=137778 RepID=A0A3D8J7N9_9HELI|nr:hypothetical protein [Helicobacter aurati]RDU73432.1 hypothetical protein CQA66_01865 [Helicobacter aurati]
MRVIEPESKQGTLLLIIITLVFSYFGWYILASISLLVLLFWLLLCSSKIIIPTNPQGIISPINGKVTQLKQEKDSITIDIATKWNARVYAPSDLNDITLSHTNGFYFITNNPTATKLSANDKLEATILLEQDYCYLTMYLFPRCFKFCTLHTNGDKALFLDKIGFLNIGKIRITLNGKNLQPSIKEGDSVKAGISTIITKQQSQDN